MAPEPFLGKFSVQGSVCGSVEPWPVSGGSAPARAAASLPAGHSRVTDAPSAGLALGMGMIHGRSPNDE